jgi:hypothetical protein
MTGNPLGQQQYTVNVIIGEVGWLTEKEAADIVEAVGNSQGRFDKSTDQLHLYWSLYADSMTEATAAAHLTLSHAREATGVCAPRTTVFEVREIGTEEARIAAYPKN